MEKSLSSLKRAIGRSPVNERGRRRYGKKLREQIVQAAIAARGDGQTLTQISKELGIRDQLLGSWVRKSGARPQVRRVEVIAEAAKQAPTLQLRLPGGAVVEGLTLGDVSVLLGKAS